MASFFLFFFFLIMTHSAKIYFCTVTVRLLEPGHSGEDYPVKTFFEEKRIFRVFFFVVVVFVFLFFTNGPMKFKVQLCNC